MRSHLSHRPLVISLLLASAACDEAPADGGRAGAACDGPTPEERAKNQVIFDGLSGSCAGCHASGARGYFESIEAFESLLAYEPSLVVPGDPDGSELVRLLEGKGTRAFKQMPIAGKPYAGLVEAGNATLTVAAIREWVGNLQAQERDERPSIDAPRVTRIGANEVIRVLYAQLGLSDDDFFQPASSFDLPMKSAQGDGNYPIASPDSTPAPYEGLPAERFASLGGGSAMFQVATDATPSPSFLGTITQVSQAWCRLALEKPGNAALLPAGTTLGGSGDAAAVKALIRHWSLHFHAVGATEEEIDAVYQDVFLPLEAETDALTGYVGTCSSFIRHPRWIFY
jgi:hypothetical protein